MSFDIILLCLAAAVAGAMNAIAGGGTLLTFPTLYAILGTSGEARRLANCTNTVALMPGALAAAWDTGGNCGLHGVGCYGWPHRA